VLAVGVASGARDAGASVTAPTVSETSSPAVVAASPRRDLGAVFMSGRTVAAVDTFPACVSQRPPAGLADSARARATRAMQNKTDLLLVTSDEYEGWKIFHVYCYRCHGVDALGSDIAPHLMKSLQETVTHDCFIGTVTNGRPTRGMPTWGAGSNPLLNAKQIEQVYAYVKARADGRLAPGRPHKASTN